MVTDQQVRKLMAELLNGETLERSCRKAGMSEQTGRKWRQVGHLPSACREPHLWRTRADPFAEVWPEVSELLAREPGLQAKTVFEELQRRFPGRFSAGQLRTLQRRVKVWRALEGPPKEVFFPQVHHPGVRGESDFSDLNELGVTIGGERFEHKLYHFVLAYSNWETGTICFSESFESVSEGLRNALFELGGVPQRHRTDRLTAAVQSLRSEAQFNRQYQTLLAHYGLAGEKTQAGKPHENGDVEQSHHRIKEALKQALLLRGSREFVDRAAYEGFVGEVLARRNAGRQARFAQEQAVLRPLPARRLESWRWLEARVGPSSTIRVLHNVYSVASGLIGEQVRVRVSAQRLEVWYAQRLVESLPRLRGQYRQHIQYRHLIDWLVRKPGAFAGYHYRQELFPTSRFRMAYDALKASCGARADKEYLRLLHLAARENEQRVDDALRVLLEREAPLTAEAVQALVVSHSALPPATQIAIEAVDLASYDALLQGAEVVR
jgi:hypothetical protein